MTLLHFFFLGDELSCTEYIQLELDLSLPFARPPLDHKCVYKMLDFMLGFKIQADFFGAFFFLKIVRISISYQINISIKWKC